MLRPMIEQNPYAPPASDDQEAPSKKKKSGKRKGGEREFRVWREGDAVVTYKQDARMPKRCVACNAPISGDREPRQFSWHPRWVYATIFCGWLPYFLIAMAVRKYAKVELGLCDEHHHRRKQGLAVLWGGLAAMLAFIIIGAATQTMGLLFLGFALVIVIIIGARMSTMVSPTKIDDHHIWLKVGPPFLASIPYRED